MVTVYAVWEIYPFIHPAILKAIYSTKEKAEARVVELNGAIPSDYQPEYDDYGLVSGIDYEFYPCELDPD